MKEISNDEMKKDLDTMMMKKELIEKLQPKLIEKFQNFLTQKIKEELSEMIAENAQFKEIENFILEKVREFLTKEVEGNLGKMEIDRALADELEKEIIARGEQFLSLKIADFLNKNSIKPSFEGLKEEIFEKIRNLLEKEKADTRFIEKMKEFVIGEKYSSETERARLPKNDTLTKPVGKKKNLSKVIEIDTADEIRNALINKISEFLDTNEEKFSNNELRKHSFRKIREFLSEEKRILYMQRRECLIEKLLDFLTIKMREFICNEEIIALSYQLQKTYEEMNCCSSGEGCKKALYKERQRILIDKIRRNLINKWVNKPIDQSKFEFIYGNGSKYKHNLRYEFERDMKFDESLNGVLKKHIIKTMESILTEEIKEFLSWKMEKLLSEVCIKRGKPDILEYLNRIKYNESIPEVGCTEIVTSKFVEWFERINPPDIKTADLRALNEESDENWEVIKEEY